MTEGEKVFLIAAQEMNFTRAAEKAFVTPQCLSDHIKRLEKQYNAPLFARKPKLRLTQEGITLQKWLQRIQIMEHGMVNELTDISRGLRGTIRLGLPTTRGEIMIPKILPAFQKRYPNIDVQVWLNDTKELEKLLLAGELDIFLGVGASQNRAFQRIPITSEPLYLVIPFHLLKEQFLDNTPDVLRRFQAEGADLALLKHIPLVLGHNGNTTSEAIRRFLLEQEIRFSIPIKVSNFDILVDLCLAGDYATICTRSHLRRLIKLDHRSTTQNRICVFAIQNCDVRLDIALISHRDIPSVGYLDRFSQLLEERIRQEDQAVKTWLEQIRSRDTQIDRKHSGEWAAHVRRESPASWGFPLSLCILPTKGAERKQGHYSCVRDGGLCFARPIKTVEREDWRSRNRRPQKYDRRR